MLVAGDQRFPSFRVLATLSGIGAVDVREVLMLLAPSDGTHERAALLVLLDNHRSKAVVEVCDVPGLRGRVVRNSHRARGVEDLRKLSVSRRDGLHGELSGTVDAMLDARTTVQSRKRVARCRGDANVGDEDILQLDLLANHVVVEEVAPPHTFWRVVLRLNGAVGVLVADRAYQKLRAVLITVMLESREEAEVYRRVVLGRSDDPTSGLLDALRSVLRHGSDGVITALVNNDLRLLRRNDDTVF